MQFRREDQLSETERQRVRREVSAHVHRADYGAALKAADKWRRRHPGDFSVAAHYASVLGDYAEQFPAGKRKRLQAKSVRIMRSLLLRTACRPHPRVVGMLKNEYFWQTKQRRKQYQLGVWEARRGTKGGYYSQGVGAAWHALELARRGQRLRARRWADRAVTAWRRFEKAVPDYYNQFVHRALAEGVRGRPRAMEDCLRRGAKFARKPLGYREFAEVREAVTSLSRARPGEVSLREFMPRDIEAVLSYFFDSPRPFLRSMGLRARKPGDRERWVAGWRQHFAKARRLRGAPIRLTILYKGRRVGIHTLTHIEPRRSAIMHAHFFRAEDRRLGIGRLSYVLAMRRLLREHRLKEIIFKTPLINAGALRIKQILGLRPRGTETLDWPVLRPGIRARVYRVDRRALAAAARRVGL